MMAKPDEGHKLTDRELAKLEKCIASVYGGAAKELQKTIDDYFESFAKRDKEMQDLIGTIVNGKEWTEADYKQWRLAQIGRGKRFEALRDKVARRYTNANETAVSYVNDATPGIYSLNRNYAAYTIEQVAGNADFILWDEQTVKRLIAEQPDLMPYYPPKRAVKRGIDLAYGKKQITASVTSSILQGKSVKHMADDLQDRISTMSRDSAIRTARTAVTGAQNAGRIDSYTAAQKMGIKLQKEWLATLDGRTRHSHAMLDGEKIDNDKKFSNGCMFPGDPSGPLSEIYNCRCTLIAAVEGVDTSDTQRRARDPERGESVVISDMSYAEWAGWKKDTGRVASADKSAIIKEKAEKGGAVVQKIGRIDVEKYKRAADGVIRSEALVLTENQKEHIIKRRGQAFYDKYSPYFAGIAEEPDYIFADEAHKNTAIASKTIAEHGKNINIVIRLALVGDDDGLENSIITAIVEGERRYQQRLRNKIPLYKKE